MSSAKKIVIGMGATLVAIGALYGAVMATSAFLDNQYASLHQGCSPHHTSYEVTIKNDIVTPSNTVAAKCDTLTIKNLDNVDRIMAFGVHEQHTSYDGVEEKELQANQTLEITLIQTGSFKFHDHMHDEVAGTFQVK